MLVTPPPHPPRVCTLRSIVWAGRLGSWFRTVGACCQFAARRRLVLKRISLAICKRGGGGEKGRGGETWVALAPAL